MFSSRSYLHHNMDYSFQIYYYNNDIQTGVLAILIFASISVLTFIFSGTNINYLYGLDAFKVIVTLIKYIPQVYLNYSNLQHQDGQFIMY